ncbi:hypothetical protein DWF00_23670 [Bosea caraganae]|uniref:PepSY domain-containing protein n=1 Tax=Bosea caraganae TaxID=2763117 RepID=A0A370L256_9HYPH|nr:hypothetical protein [Bosea caraganae]RDJ22159.1 hypothetical protein DWE98_19875 [Bosea caraganae]RDJ22754.1 hypothetical protein DWF00_23670 [Bosea caraganae]
MFHLASLAAVAALAATLVMPAGNAWAQSIEPEQEQEEEGLRPPEPVPQQVPRYREARPDEPGLRYRRVEPEAEAPRPAEPEGGVPRYGQAEPEDVTPPRYRQPEPEESDELEPRYRRDPLESITTDDALRIARGEGLARVGRVREGRRGWVIVGIDRNGDDMRIVINRSGEVVDVQRE